MSKLAGIQEDDHNFHRDKDTWSIIERIESIFDKFGTLTDHQYDKFEAQVLTNLEKNEAKYFEEGHAKLGTLLGYDGGNRNDTASPDPWWIVNGSLCFIFEDHSDGNEGGTLSVDKARQACTHPNWVRENLQLDADARIISVLITPAAVADNAALPHLKEVLLWPLDDFRTWARNAITVIREIRKDYPNSGDLAWRALTAEKLDEANISPASLLDILSANIASELLRKTP